MAITNGIKLKQIIDAVTGEAYDDPLRNMLFAFENLCQAVVISSGLTTPPSAPSSEDSYIVGLFATGAWSGKDNNIAVWSEQPNLTGSPLWVFYQPSPGWLVWDLAASGYTFFNSTQWSGVNAQRGNLSGETALTLKSTNTAGVQLSLDATAVSGGQDWTVRSGGTGSGALSFTNQTSSNTVLSLQAGGSIPHPGISLNSSQTLSAVTGNGPTLCTGDGNTLATDSMVMTDAHGNFVDSGVLRSDVVQTDIVNTFTADNTFESTTTFLDPAIHAAATPASGSANFDGPAISLQSNYWNGTASEADQWLIQPLLGGGTNPASELSIAHAGSSGVASVNFTTPVTVGNLSLSAATTTGSASAGVITSPGNIYGFLAMNINGVDVRIPYFAP